jgi:hypothetical protein
MNRVQRWIVGAALLGALLAAEGCLLFVAGAVAGAAVGAVSYAGNELRVTQEVTVDKAYKAATAAMPELEFTIIPAETRKDATGGRVAGRNARDQKVVVDLLRKGDRLTELHIRVGDFDTAANRAAAQTLYDKMRTHL